MKRILPWFLMPLAMMAAFIGIVFITHGADLSISQNSDCLTVSINNNTSLCTRVQWSNDLQTWWGYGGGFSDMGVPFTKYSFDVKTNQQRTFWRTVECTVPQ